MNIQAMGKAYNELKQGEPAIERLFELTNFKSKVLYSILLSSMHKIVTSILDGALKLQMLSTTCCCYCHFLGVN